MEKEKFKKIKKLLFFACIYQCKVILYRRKEKEDQKNETKNQNRWYVVNR